MKEIMNLVIDEIKPDRRAVLLCQGITSEVKISARIEDILDRAMEIFSQNARPAGVIREIEVSEFATIYEGEGNNENRTPVADIYPHAHNLALFAVTMGEKISAMIDGFFKSNEFAEGCMLDSIASEAADRAADVIENAYREYLTQKGMLTEETGVLRYSPGYCGWHISAQKKLFEYLGPEKIGITLRESYLMEPLKSISGVIIAGPKQIHKFENDYPCCEKCDNQTCQDRMQSL
jgi:cobalamin-dependent methionine synthase I